VAFALVAARMRRTSRQLAPDVDVVERGVVFAR
jgi:hypothetical protein